MQGKIEKACAISNAKIQFVSLVDKAANKRKFLITKSDGKSASFQTFGKILKTDADSHFVTGIVYEPMTEDTDGNFMTESEITKAAHWFMKNDGNVDLQHCFEKTPGVDVVESYVAKSDMEIEGVPVTKGTWLMTMEIADNDVWDAVQKGEITGFSMGGVGCYSTEDVDLAEVKKSEEPVSLLKRIAKSLGLSVVEKGAVKTTYHQRIKGDNFYTAWNALRDTLEGYEYDPELGTWNWDYSSDEEKIREALADFSEIVTSILTSGSVLKSLNKAAGESNGVVTKAGKSLSSKNLETLQDISNRLSNFLSAFEDQEDDEGDADVEKSSKKSKKEDEEMTGKEVEEIAAKAVEKAMKPIVDQLDAIAKGEDGAGIDIESSGKEATDDDVTEIVDKAVEKAVQPIAEKLDAICKSRAIPENLGSAVQEDVQKSAPHYLHGIL